MERLLFPLYGALRISIVVERQQGFVSRLVRRCSAAPDLVLCACFGYGGSYSGSLRVGEIPVLAHRNQECSGLLRLRRRGLKSDVTVVEVSGFVPRVCASGSVPSGRLWP